MSETRAITSIENTKQVVREVRAMHQLIVQGRPPKFSSAVKDSSPTMLLSLATCTCSAEILKTGHQRLAT